VVAQLEGFLGELVAGMAPETARSGPGRPRVLPSLCLWLGLVVCVVRGFSSQLALWRLLRAGGFWLYPRVAISDEAVYQRLARAGTAPMERLFDQVRAVLAERLAPWTASALAPFATDVLALDETTLDPVARRLPELRSVPRGDRACLPGKLAGLFDVRRQQWRRIQYLAAPGQNEKVAARDMLQDLLPGTLLLADLGYFAFAWFDELSERGLWWVSRLRNKTSYIVLHRFFQDADTFDGLVWLGAHRADRAKHAVRLVRFRVGTTSFQYITNVQQPATLPILAIARLYARRWDIELAFLLVKQHLGLHLLWSAKTVVVLQQVWAVLIISQILQALRLEIAGRAQVDPYDVSMALLVQYLPEFAHRGQDPIAMFVSQGRELGFIRPSRRIRRDAPEIPLVHYAPVPPDLVLTRPARYAGR
jgi:hypothetical protein